MTRLSRRRKRVELTGEPIWQPGFDAVKLHQTTLFYAEQWGLILFFSSGVTTLLMTPVTPVMFTCKSLQILWEETKQGLGGGGGVAISCSGMRTPLTSVNPSANIEFGWVLR